MEIERIGGMEMLAVETEKLTKKFGDFTALDKLDLSIAEGETYGLLGPNGSGKTTTIKILTGLTKATSGNASILGKQVPSKAIMQKIGYMPQETAVYLDNTVHENLALYAQIFGMSAEETSKRESTMLKFVDLTDWKDSMVTNLSGGMKHRLSLACALIHEPKLLLLDEPTVGVDPELRATFWEYFRKLADKGITVIITTHYMDEASHCTKVGLLRQGRLIAEGQPEALKKQYGKESLEDVFLTLARRRDVK
jgi:ABC-2 type transport system ATP-binding protein